MNKRSLVWVLSALATIVGGATAQAAAADSAEQAVASAEK